MKQVSTGVGLCVLGLCIVGYPMAERLASRAEAGVPGAAVTVAAAATAQDPPAPTIVWYGTAAISPAVGSGYSESPGYWLIRAWSSGRIEQMHVRRTTGQACVTDFCFSPWTVVSDPAQGLTFDADLNFDQAVDGVDLGMMLAKWGPAPRNPVPPSDCPLALINP